MRQDVDQLRGGVEIADEQQILDERDDRRHHFAPALVDVLDAQQVEHQRQVERPQDAGRDGREPRADPLGGIVVDLLDVDRPRPRARQLASVLVGHERLVAVGGEQLLRDVIPHAFEAFGVAERRLGDVLVREHEQPLAVERPFERPELRVLRGK